MKLNKRWIVALLMLTIVLCAGSLIGRYWYTHRYLVSTDNAYVQADVIDIRPEIQGRIRQVPVHDNQFVHKGQLLIEIEPADFEAEAQRTLAQLDSAKATSSEVSEQIALQGKKLEAAQADIAAAEAEAQRSHLELERAQALAHQEYGSRQRLESAQADDKVARARLLQSRASFAAEKQNLQVLKAKLTSAKAMIASAQASALYAENQLRKTRIIAPADGVVGDLGARIGNLATPSMSLLRVVPIPNVYVTANYKETQIDRMAIGQPAMIHVDAFPELTFQGVVASLAPATGTEFSLLPTDNATGNFNKIVQRVPVRIRVTGPKDSLPRLRPGLSVETEVDTRDFDPRLNYLDKNHTTANIGNKLATQ
jgi:membrane fusion protein (multidrug efflux system)